MEMNLATKHAMMIAVGGFVFYGTAFAAPPQPNVFDGGNRWQITFYNDPTNHHDQWATQTICFLPYAVVGNSIQGTWYSTSFPDWNGRYYQEGDELKMTGDYAKDVGHDHMTLQHTTYDVPGFSRGMAFKDWTEWREDGAYGNIIGWGNSILVRAGKCDLSSGIHNVDKLALEDIRLLEDEAMEISFSLPDRLTLKGEIARYPGQSDLESLDEYQRRTGIR
jgi:hypothetical protein